jgi:ketosteroid isomerase-like protein
MRDWGIGLILLFLSALFATPSFASESPYAITSLESELRATEAAFAKTMAERDHAAFRSFLADEAVFFSGETALRGADAVAEAWSRFYQGPDAPFSWEPGDVAVLESGTLGLSSGPVFDPQGNRVGTFNSVWRRGADGTWKIVFDRGCDCP